MEAMMMISRIYRRYQATSVQDRQFRKGTVDSTMTLCLPPAPVDLPQPNYSNSTSHLTSLRIFSSLPAYCDFANTYQTPIPCLSSKSDM